MAYNTRNKLLRAQWVQEQWATHSKNNHSGSGGCTDEWIYANIIFPQLRISRSTFYSYLLIPVKKELDKLDNQQKKQLTLSL